VERVKRLDPEEFDAFINDLGEFDRTTEGTGRPTFKRRGAAPASRPVLRRARPPADAPGKPHDPP
jgi:hypothetical protein